MNSFDHRSLTEACRHLFGDGIDVSPEFLSYIQLEGVRTAYRRRARETHPDRQGDESCEEFLRVRSSYELLSSFINHRPVSPVCSISHRSHSISRCTGPILFGRFLHRSGVISFQELLDALAWQRSTYPRIGELARERCGLSRSDVLRIMTSPFHGRFGARAVRDGSLTTLQVERLLLVQRYFKKPLGEYFVQKGILTQDDVKALVRDQRLHNASVRFR